MSRLIRVGEGGAIDLDQVLIVGRPRSQTIKRLLAQVSSERLIDLTYGYPRRSVILLTNGYWVFLSLTPEDLYQKGASA